FLLKQVPLYFGLITIPERAQADQTAKPVRVEACENIFAGGAVLQFDQNRFFLDHAKPLAPGEAEAALLRLVDWHEQRNLYPAGTDLLRWTIQWGQTEAPRSCKVLADWEHFWGLADTDSLQGDVRFQRSELLAEVAAPQPPAPQDFRLQPESPGKG